MTRDKSLCREQTVVESVAHAIDTAISCFEKQWETIGGFASFLREVKHPRCIFDNT